jgi:hypothetical protein
MLLILYFDKLGMLNPLQMKGETQLVEKLLQTEINLLRSIRDGSAVMQHMEDFYYVTLLEVCAPSSLHCA